MLSVLVLNESTINILKGGTNSLRNMSVRMKGLIACICTHTHTYSIGLNYLLVTHETVHPYANVLISD